MYLIAIKCFIIIKMSSSPEYPSQYPYVTNFLEYFLTFESPIDFMKFDGFSLEDILHSLQA